VSCRKEEFCANVLKIAEFAIIDTYCINVTNERALIAPDTRASHLAMCDRQREKHDYEYICVWFLAFFLLLDGITSSSHHLELVF